MAHKNPHLSKRRAFLNGLLMPVPGMKRIDEQIKSQAVTSGNKDTVGFFALGSMFTSYPMVFTICLAIYTGIDVFLSNRMF